METITIFTGTCHHCGGRVGAKQVSGRIIDSWHDSVGAHWAGHPHAPMNPTWREVGHTVSHADCPDCTHCGGRLHCSHICPNRVR